MDILDVLIEDYRKFPHDQTYSVYTEDVYFKDPVYEYRGRDRYQRMIEFIKTWFLDPKLDLQAIQRTGDTIRTDWTLSWTTPLPWKPRIHINGWSQLTLNGEDQITAHIDYWHCSRWDVIKQLVGL
jgi:hypothetical protein